MTQLLEAVPRSVLVLFGVTVYLAVLAGAHTCAVKRRRVR